MNLKSGVFALALATTMALSACQSEEQQAAAKANAGVQAAVAASAESPAAAVAVGARNLRENNLKALVDASVPPEYLAQLHGKWTAKLNEAPITDAKRAEFKADMDKLTAVDAEKKLWQEMAPKLAKLKAESAAQMPMVVGIGRGVLVSAVQQNEDLNEPQKQQAVKAINAFATWAESAQFTDPVLAQKALGVVCQTARELKFASLDEVRALTFDQALAKGDIAFKGLKQVFELYGLSIDQTLDSVKAVLVSETGDQAKVKVSYTLLATPLEFESEMVRYQGRWYGADGLRKMQKEAAESAVAKAVAPAAKG